MNDNPFQILDQSSLGKPIENTFQGEEINERLKKLTNAAKIVLFMKGNAQEPMCGFSANTVAILQSLKVDFKTFNILSDDAVRQGLKEYSQWPTYPQLYVNGELLGGNDIITEMYQAGELADALK